MHGDEGAFRKWVGFELDTLHAGLVTQRRALADLLLEQAPQAKARSGAHAFDRRELERLAARLPTELRYALRLPMHLYTDSEVGDALYTMERPVAEALRHLGYTMAEPDAKGKLWVARALALQALRDWPTCVQFVHL